MKTLKERAKIVLLLSMMFVFLSIPQVLIGTIEDNLLLIIDDMLCLVLFPAGITSIIQSKIVKYHEKPFLDKTRKRIIIFTISVAVILLIILSIYTTIMLKPIQNGYMSWRYVLLKRRIVFIICLAMTYLIGEERYSN